MSELLCINHPAIIIPMVTKLTIIVAKAFITGLIPVRTLEKTSIGKVVEPGPERKLASTTSSKDKVKASNQPAAIEGNIKGSVILKNTVIGRAPRSKAASSNCLSNSRKLK